MSSSRPTKLSEITPEDYARIEFLHKHFFNRVDIICCLAPWGTPCPAIPLRPLSSVLISHVTGLKAKNHIVEFRTSRGNRPNSGPLRIGSYGPNVDGLTNWICFDIDGPGHDSAVADPLSTVWQLTEALSPWACPLWEKSASGTGWHGWVFFDKPVDVQIIREYIFNTIPKTVLLSTGKAVPMNSNLGVELFPKSARIVQGGVGSMVWLPFWSGARGSANEFHRIRPGKTPIQLDVRDIELNKVKDYPDDYHRALSLKSASRQTKDTEGLTEDQLWRLKALQILQPEIPYGKYLTGNMRGSYLECRNPESSSGDRRPSAGVSLGESGQERLCFHTFNPDYSMSVFDFLMKYQPGIRTFQEARQFVSYHTGVPLPKRR